MPNEQVVAYLKEHQEQFSQEVLVEQLKQTGYPEADIREGVSVVYGQSAAASSVSVGFWDFKTPRTYITSAGKTKDALFGFFVPLLFFWFPLGTFVVDVFFLVYFWSRRKYIARGVLWRWIASIVLAILGILVFVWSIHG